MYTPKQKAYEAFEKQIIQNCILYAECDFNVLESSNLDAFNGFHASDSFVLHFPDDRHFNGIRANTFVIEVGWHEWVEGDAFLVSANHKGIRLMKLYTERKN